MQPVKMGEYSQASEDKRIETEQTLSQPSNNRAPHIEIFSKLTSTHSIGELKVAITDILNECGFSDFFFSATDHAGAKYLTTLPQDIPRMYFSGEKAKKDLVFMHSHLSSKPVLMSSIENCIHQAPVRLPIFNQFIEMSNKLKENNFHDFYALINKHKIGTMLLIICDKGTPVDVFRERNVGVETSYIQLVAEAIAVLSVERFPEYFSSTPIDDKKQPYKKKPLQLITQLARENITLKDAADQMNISLDTANKYVAKMKKYFGVNTIATTVYRAIESGLINFDEPTTQRSQKSEPSTNPNTNPNS